jgi:hypothetical protein
VQVLSQVQTEPGPTPAPLHVWFAGQAEGLPAWTKRQLSPSVEHTDWWLASGQKLPFAVQPGSDGALHVQDCAPAVPVQDWRAPQAVGPPVTMMQASVPGPHVVTVLPPEQYVPALPPAQIAGDGLHWHEAAPAAPVQAWFGPHAVDAPLTKKH